MPCNNWLGLDNYKPDSFKSKTIWLNQQLNAMLNANKQTLKLINKSMKHNKDHTGRKELTIPVGIMYFCVINQKVGTRSKTGTSLMLYCSWSP